MVEGKRIICVIPARLESSRFPKKVLALLGGKPLIQWAWEAAVATSFFDEVVIAVDSKEVAEVVTEFGGKWEMTDVAHISGTDRLVELAQSGKYKADIWVNWQGDEPFISAKTISDLLDPIGLLDTDVWTLKKSFESLEEISIPSRTKVVCDISGKALYFSRHAIPFDWNLTVDSLKNYFLHIGIYAYTSDALHKIATFPPAALEIAERLEQLRYLYHGLKIHVSETKETSIGIDLPEDLIRAENFLSEYNKLNV